MPPYHGDCRTISERLCAIMTGMSNVCTRRKFLGAGSLAVAGALVGRQMRAQGEGSRALRDRIRRELARGPIFNTHEHLVPEAKRLADPLDIFTLISHYALSDVISAGLDGKAAAGLTRYE